MQLGIPQWKSANFVVSVLLRLKLILQPTQSPTYTLVVQVPLHKTEQRIGSNEENHRMIKYVYSINNSSMYGNKYENDIKWQ